MPPSQISWLSACQSHRAHVDYLRVLKEAHSRSADFRPEQDCIKALAWLRSNVARLDCERLLLEIEDTLARAPEALSRAYDREGFGYSDVHGVLLAELIRRTRERGSKLPEKIWERLFDGFGGADSWVSKQHFIQVALATLKSLLRSNGTPRLEPRFWELFDTITTHLRAALEVRGGLPRSESSPDEPLLAAGRDFAELQRNLAQHISELAPDSECLRQMAIAGGVELDVLMRCRGTLAEWLVSIAKLCEALPPDRDKRDEQLQQELDRVSSALTRYAKSEKVQARRRTFEDVLPIVKPLLDGRQPAGARRRMRLEDEPCQVALPRRRPTLLLGRITNVCASQFRGFAVELPQVAFQERGRGAPGVGREVALSFRYGGGSRQLSLPCKVVRAWRLSPGQGTGLALFAPEHLTPVLPDEWRTYVTMSPLPGRYNAVGP